MFRSSMRCPVSATAAPTPPAAWRPSSTVVRSSTSLPASGSSKEASTTSSPCPRTSRPPSRYPISAPGWHRSRMRSATWYDSPRPLDLRYCESSPWERKEKLPPFQNVWLRANGTLPDDPVLHICILTYASDMSLLDTTLGPHGESFTAGDVFMASLDHAMWFHRPFRSDEWLLYAQDTPSASNGRGLARGLVFTRAGTPGGFGHAGRRHPQDAREGIAMTPPASPGAPAGQHLVASGRPQRGWRSVLSSVSRALRPMTRRVRTSPGRIRPGPPHPVVPPPLRTATPLGLWIWRSWTPGRTWKHPRTHIRSTDSLLVAERAGKVIELTPNDDGTYDVAGTVVDLTDAGRKHRGRKGSPGTHHRHRRGAPVREPHARLLTARRWSSSSR